jgi:class 3 adenylate cyclase
VARAVLVIADIGGYTRFMKVHRINLAHAQHIVARLLEAVIDGAGRKLKLAKLEGDAAFFYANAPMAKDDAKQVFVSIRNAFLQRRDEMAINRLCNCDGCTQAGELKLKFVAHVGEVAFQKVKRYTELAGVDVIIVHRLLKNAVPLSEYVLMSEALHDEIAPTLGTAASAIEQELEGLGHARNYYVELDALSGKHIIDVRPSFVAKLVGWLRMTWRSLPYFIGLRKACEGFGNMNEVLAILPTRPSASSLSQPPSSGEG